MNIGERIRLLRKNLKLTQAEFGQKIGLKPTAIGQMENGSRNVTDRTIILLCEKYNVNKQWLLSGNGDMFIEQQTFSLDEDAQKNNLTPLELDIIKGYMELDQNTRHSILKHFKTIFNKHNNDEIAATIDKNSPDMDIEEELNKYRLELEAEQKGKTSKVSENLESKNMA